MRILAFLAMMFLTSCGFQPLYASHAGGLPKEDVAVTAEIAKIYVVPIENHLGQLMRQRLNALLAPSGVKQKEYSLAVVNVERLISEQGIRTDNVPTRITIGYESSYTLKKGDKIILQDSASSQSSYNVLSNAYSTVTAKEKVKERLIMLLAQDISLRITVFFKDYLAKQKQISGENSEVQQ